MTGEMARRLAEFVDRRDEMARFCEMLDGNDKRIMAVWGDSGLGKSSLLARMVHETAQRGIRKTELVWTNTRRHDYLAVMRKLRDDVGVGFFNGFTDLLNYFTVPQYTLKVAIEGSVAVANGARVDRSSIGDIAGVVIKDSMIVLPRSDMVMPESERMILLTNRFLEGLVAASAQERRIIVFFDAVEKMELKTHEWVWGELFQAVLDGRLPAVRCVLCGQQRPELGRDMEFIVEDAQLKPLDLPDIIEYLGKRGIEESSRKGVAYTLLVAAKGNPLLVASYVDGVLKMQARSAA